MSDRAKLVQIYIAFYNRAPDPEGLAFWQSACDIGLSLEEIADLFVPQSESIATYPFLDNPTEDGIRSFLQAVYENLFNREPDAEGETFWTNQILQSLASEGSVDADGNQIDPSGLSIGEVLLSIICGAQGDDITALDNKTTVALDFHDQAAVTPNFIQDSEAASASRLALGVVDETDFSVVQGEVLNENFFEETAPPVFTPFTPGNFSPLVPQGEIGLDEAPVNGFLLGNQIVSDVAVLSDGKLATVYEIRGTGGVQVAVQLRNAGGSLSGPDSFLLSEVEMAVGAVVTSPQVLALPDGGFIVLVRSFADAGADAALVAHRFDTFGIPAGEPVVVLDEGEIDIISSFNVAYQPTGNLIYTFAGDENFDGFSVDADTYVKVMTPDGETVVDTQVVNDNDATTTDEDESVVASLPDGTSLVVYETTDEAEDGDENAIIGQLYDVNGAAVGGPILINGFTARDQIDPAITALGDDRFLVTFQTFAQVLDPQSGGISAVILDRDGGIDVDEFLINASTAGNQGSPQVAELPNGNFVVVWSSSGDIHARIFEDDGSPVTVNDIVVNTLTTGSQSRPQVAVSQDGFVVTWDSNTPTIDDPFGFGTRMAAFDEGGMRVPLPDVPNPNVSVLMTGEFQVNNEVFAQQSDPGVVGLADGRSVFSYFDDESGGTLFEIRDANGLPLTDDMVALQSDAMAAQNDLPEARDVEMFATPDGGFVMVGTVRFNDTLGAGVRMQIFDSDLTPGDIIAVSIGGPVASNEGAEVVVGADGTIYVGWTFTSGGVSTMMLRTFAADGTPESGPTTTHGPQPNGGIDLDAISVSSDGNILLIGEGDNLAGASDSDL